MVKLTVHPQFSWHPAIVCGPGGRLDVFWQDNRNGGFKIYGRNFDGAAWQAEYCLSPSGLASAYPSAASSQGRPAVALSLAGLATAAAFWATNAMLASRPGGFGEMGLVNMGMQWMNAVLFMPTLLAMIGLPIMAERRSAGDAGGVRAALGLNLALAGLLALLAAGAVAGGGRLILGFYGPEFAGGRPVKAVMALAGFVSALSLPACGLLLAEGRYLRYLLLTLAWAAALVLSFAFLAGQGALGLAWAHLAAAGIFLAGLWPQFALILVTNK